MLHGGTKILKTERLTLRPFTTEDADAMFRHWASDDEVTKYLTWPTHKTPSGTKYVLGLWEKEYEKPDYYCWALELNSIGEVIGSISVVKIDESTSSGDLGWCIGRSFWGQGLVPEAAREIIKYLFEEVGFERITACHDKNNPKSGRVMQKVGMTCEGTFRRAGRNNQGICDVVYYAILKDEYESLNK